MLPPRIDGTSPSHSVLHTRICDLLGVRYPIVQTGMGWVSGAHAHGGDERRRRLRHPRRGDDDARRARRGDPAPSASAPTDPSASTCGPTSRASRRPPTSSSAIKRDARELRRPAASAISSSACRTAACCTMPTIGAPRHAAKMAEWGVDAVIAQGHEGGGHTGPIPTSLLLPGRLPSDRHSGARRGRVQQRARLWSRRSPTAPPASPWARASS